MTHFLLDVDVWFVLEQALRDLDMAPYRRPMEWSEAILWDGRAVRRYKRNANMAARVAQYKYTIGAAAAVDEGKRRNDARGWQRTSGSGGRACFF